MRLPLLATLFAAATLPLASCGGGDQAQTPKELYAAAAKAFNDKDYADVVQHLQSAVDGMGDESSDLLKKAHVMMARAQAHLSPEKARTAFQDFAAGNSDLVSVADFADVANALMDSEGGPIEAAQLVGQAKKVFPDQVATFEGIDKLIAEKKAAGEFDEDQMAILEGLGYM